MKPVDIMIAVGRARAYLSGGETEPYKGDTTKLIAEALIALQERVFEKAVAGDVIENETAHSPLVFFAMAARMGRDGMMTVPSGGRTLVAVELPRNCKMMDRAWPSMEAEAEMEELQRLRIRKGATDALEAQVAEFAVACAERPMFGDIIVIDHVRRLIRFAYETKLANSDEIEMVVRG